jgi:hypothetical protein
MKKFALLLAVLFAAGVAVAQDMPKDSTKAPKAAVKAAPAKTHDVDAEVVSVDATAKTITIKADPDNKTVPVEGKAITQLKDVKPGEKVTLSCRDNEAGEHQAVVAIKAGKAGAKSESKPN